MKKIRESMLFSKWVIKLIFENYKNFCYNIYIKKKKRLQNCLYALRVQKNLKQKK